MDKSSTPSKNHLISAIKSGDLVAVNKALSRGTAIDDVDSQGWTPLFHAAVKGDVGLVSTLLEAGANVNHGGSSGFTALFAAVLAGHTRVIQALLAAGAEIGRVQGKELETYAGFHSPKLARKIVSLLRNELKSDTL